MNIKLLTKHHLEFLSLTGGCTCSFESTLVKMPHCWKSHVAVHNIPYSYLISYLQFGGGSRVISANSFCILKKETKLYRIYHFDVLNFPLINLIV